MCLNGFLTQSCAIHVLVLKSHTRVAPYSLGEFPVPGWSLAKPSLLATVSWSCRRASQRLPLSPNPFYHIVYDIVYLLTVNMCSSTSLTSCGSLLHSHLRQSSY